MAHVQSGSRSSHSSCRPRLRSFLSYLKLELQVSKCYMTDADNSLDWSHHSLHIDHDCSNRRRGPGSTCFSTCWRFRSRVLRLWLTYLLERYECDSDHLCFVIRDIRFHPYVSDYPAVNRNLLMTQYRGDA